VGRFSRKNIFLGDILSNVLTMTREIRKNVIKISHKNTSDKKNLVFLITLLKIYSIYSREIQPKDFGHQIISNNSEIRSD